MDNNPDVDKKTNNVPVIDDVDWTSEYLHEDIILHRWYRIDWQSIGWIALVARLF